MFSTTTRRRICCRSALSVWSFDWYLLESVGTGHGTDEGRAALGRGLVTLTHLTPVLVLSTETLCEGTVRNTEPRASPVVKNAHQGKDKYRITPEYETDTV